MHAASSGCPSDFARPRRRWTASPPRCAAASASCARACSPRPELALQEPAGGHRTWPNARLGARHPRHRRARRRRGGPGRRRPPHRPAARLALLERPRPRPRGRSRRARPLGRRARRRLPGGGARPAGGHGRDRVPPRPRLASPFRDASLARADVPKLRGDLSAPHRGERVLPSPGRAPRLGSRPPGARTCVGDPASAGVRLGPVYSAATIEHALSVERAGPAGPGAGAGEAGNAACGDAVRIELLLAGGRIEAARHRTFGCPHATAAAALACALAEGRDLLQAARIGAGDLERALAPPDANRPCVALAADALHAALARAADRLGAARIATGHYARLERRVGRTLVARGVDSAKDQSYMLASVPADILERCWFPLGGQTKAETRAQARRAALAAAGRAESQEACFVGGGDHRAFVERRGGAGPAGEIVDGGGRVLGRHGGLHRFPPGPRRGLGLGGGEALYVVRTEPESGRVVVGRREALARSSVRVAPGAVYIPAARVQAKLRYR